MRRERCFPSHFVGQGMGRMVPVGRHLNGELTAWAQPARQATQQLRVIGDPVQGCIAEDHVELASSSEGVDVGGLELQAVPGERTGLRQHRFRRVDPERCSRLSVLVQACRQFPRPAAQVDHSPAGNRLNHVEQVEEGLGALFGEFRVLVGIPLAGGRLPV